MNSQASATRKLFVNQLFQAKSLPESRSKYMYRGVELIRAWIQGIVVEVEAPRFAIDDGTGVVWIDMQNLIKTNPHVQVVVGEYVMIIGPVMGNNSNTGGSSPRHSPSWIQAHQVIRLSEKDMQRETLWFLEVIEYWTQVVGMPRHMIEIE